MSQHLSPKRLLCLSHMVLRCNHPTVMPCQTAWDLAPFLLMECLNMTPEAPSPRLMSSRLSPQARLLLTLDTIPALSRFPKGTCTSPARRCQCNQAAQCMVILENPWPIHLSRNTMFHSIRQCDIRITLPPTHLRALQFRIRGHTCHIAATRAQTPVMLTWLPVVLSIPGTLRAV
jgi:hypothetical protein